MEIPGVLRLISGSSRSIFLECGRSDQDDAVSEGDDKGVVLCDLLAAQGDAFELLSCPFSRVQDAKSDWAFCPACGLDTGMRSGGRALGDGGSCCDPRMGCRKTMVRRGPTSVFMREVARQAVHRGLP
jgi:hypothetical protein